MTAPGPDGRGGFVLLWCIAATMLVLATVGLMATTGKVEADRARSGLEELRAHARALGALAEAESELAAALREGNSVPTEIVAELDGAVVSVAVMPGSAPRRLPDESGLYAEASTWRLEAIGSDGRSSSRIRRIVEARIVPIFQFAWYYENDMPLIHPAPLEIQGRVHCNGDIYVHTYWDLEFDTNHLRTAGRMYAACDKPEWFDWAGGWRDQNPIRIRRWVPDPSDPAAPVEFATLPTPDSMYAEFGYSSGTGYDSAFTGLDHDLDGSFTGPDDLLPFAPFALERFGPPAAYTGTERGGTLMTREHGVERVSAPKPESFDTHVPATATEGTHVWDVALGRYRPIASGETGTHVEGAYAKKAGFRVVIDGAGDWRAFDATGSDVTSAVEPAVEAGTLYDARQAPGANNRIPTIEIDLAALAATGRFPANGLIYVAEEVGEAAKSGRKGTSIRGVVLRNGAELHGALSVVTPESLYVVGDYNTVAKKPASVMADAVNLLSNGWDDSKGLGALPLAVDTTYNVAILSGEQPLSAGFNGGPMNLPRFHEDWSGRTCRVNGSMVSLFASRFADGPWRVKGDAYVPPQRIWSYDEDFEVFSQLPPFTPKFVDVRAVIGM